MRFAGFAPKTMTAVLLAVGLLMACGDSTRTLGRIAAVLPPMVITTNRVYKHWSQIFNNDSTLTSAILDRVLHHADTVIIEGKSFRMKDEIDGQDTR